MTFNEGDRVIYLSKLTHGTVLEVFDGRVYLEMDNGVEMDFSEADLMLEAEDKSPEEVRQRDMALDDAVALKVAELIFPEVRNLFVALAMRMAAEAGAAVIALGGSASPWEETNAFHKMNFISVATNTTFVDWVTAYNDNNMAAFQLSILGAIGMRAGI